MGLSLIEKLLAALIILMMLTTIAMPFIPELFLHLI